MTHSMRHGLPVTDRMREAYELVTLHGTRLAAAERMGVSSVAVGQFVAAYCRRTGAAPPYTRSRPYALAARRIAEADDRAKDAALEVARLRAHVEWLSEQLDAERARSRDLESRLAARPIPFVPSHRRVKDGGIPVRQQRREHRRVAA